MSESATTSAKTPVDFWFDPLCPWAWMTSRWVLEVEKVRDIEVHWHVMSLAVLNESRLDELPEQYAENMRPGGKSWGPVRIAIAAQQLYGDDVVGTLYTAFGTRFHNEGLGVNPESIALAIADAGLPAELIEYGAKDTYDAELRASHKEGIEKVGQDVGTPVIAVPGADGEQVAFFGPVVTPAPKGELAARLWDGTVAVASVPGFYELKRSRSVGPDFSNL
ncbi:DsbA family protein [Streptomyces sp. NPDC087425]|uniref:mycothiol-dependent nitroreductase Rv2466c family protein n=1 Tax=Streptomyces sp. NPDC087425 TaxID=3365787 RepID=UPI0038114953